MEGIKVNTQSNDQSLLIPKYFDIFKQKVIFIDAIIGEKNSQSNHALNHFLKI